MERTPSDILRPPYTFIAVADHDNGRWVIVYPDLPGCVTQGDTYEKAARMAKDAFGSWITYRFEEGLPIPAPAFDADPAWDWESIRPRGACSSSRIGAKRGDEVPALTTGRSPRSWMSPSRGCISWRGPERRGSAGAGADVQLEGSRENAGPQAGVPGQEARAHLCICLKRHGAPTIAEAGTVVVSCRWGQVVW